MHEVSPAEGVVLYHFPPSLCSQKVRLALVEKGVQWTPRLVNIGPVLENYEPWYARINGRMVVPTLVVDGEVITDSARIMREVDRRFEGPDLGAEREDVGRWLALQDGLEIREIAYGRKGGLIGWLSKGSFDKRLVRLDQMRLVDPELTPLYDARIADVQQWQQVSASDEEIAVRRDAVIAALGEVEEALAASPFLAGDSYTLADVGWTVMLARLIFMDLDKHFGEHTMAYYARMKARDSFETADIWQRPKPMVMLPIIGQVIAMRLGLR